MESVAGMGRGQAEAFAQLKPPCVSLSACTGLWGSTWEFSFPVTVAGKCLSKCCCVLILCECV